MRPLLWFQTIHFCMSPLWIEAQCFMEYHDTSRVYHILSYLSSSLVKHFTKGLHLVLELLSTWRLGAVFKSTSTCMNCHLKSTSQQRQVVKPITSVWEEDFLERRLAIRKSPKKSFRIASPFFGYSQRLYSLFFHHFGRLDCEVFMGGVSGMEVLLDFGSLWKSAVWCSHECRGTSTVCFTWNCFQVSTICFRWKMSGKGWQKCWQLLASTKEYIANLADRIEKQKQLEVRKTRKNSSICAKVLLLPGFAFLPGALRQFVGMLEILFALYTKSKLGILNKHSFCLVDHWFPTWPVVFSHISAI